MFHALVAGRVGAPDLEFDVVMEDIEALNRRAEGHGGERLNITKLSVGTYGRVLGDYRLLEAGAALGRGCGPLVVRRPGGVGGLEDLAGLRVAVPGLGTTAMLLLRIFGPAELRPIPMRFEAVMPAVAAGEVDAGLIIHESRFTYPAFGLELVADLGEIWEQDTGLPLPLGVIAAHRTLPAAEASAVERGIRASIEHGFRDPSASHEFVRAHAQELDPEVCRQHIALYVNEYSRDLGDVGHRAIETMLARAAEL